MRELKIEVVLSVPEPGLESVEAMMLTWIDLVLRESLTGKVKLQSVRVIK